METILHGSIKNFAQFYSVLNMASMVCLSIEGAWAKKPPTNSDDMVGSGATIGTLSNYNATGN